MVCSPLHTHIPPLHQPGLPGVQDQLDLPLQHNPIVKAHSAVHRARRPRLHIHDPAHGARTDHDARRAREVVRILGDIVVVVEFGGEVRGGVREREVGAIRHGGHGHFLGQGAGEDGLAGGIVSGDIALKGANVLGFGGHFRQYCLV